MSGGVTCAVYMKLLQFVAMVLTALALVPGGAHLFTLPNKIYLGESDYFITKSVYRGWALLGIVLIGAAIANFALALLIRAQRAPSIFALIGGLCLVATLVIFFAFTFPANQATNNWTQIPPGLGATSLAMGIVARGERGDHIYRILLADHLVAVDAEVNARACPQSGRKI
jgi:hypothetical protein